MQSAAGFAVFSRMCSDPLKMSPQIVQKVLIFFPLDSELEGSSICISFASFLEQFSFIFSPFTEEITELYNRRFFSHEGISCLGAGDRDTSQRETQKRKRGRRFIQGLSGFRDSWRLRLCTNVILHESLLALPVFCQRKRQRFTHDDVPAGSGKHRSFL